MGNNRKYTRRAGEVFRWLLSVYELRHVPESILRPAVYAELRLARCRVECGPYWSWYSDTRIGAPLFRSLYEQWQATQYYYDPNQILTKLFKLFGVCCAACEMVSPISEMGNLGYPMPEATRTAMHFLAFCPLCDGCASSYSAHLRRTKTGDTDFDYELAFSSWLQRQLFKRQEQARAEILTRRQQVVTLTFDLSKRDQAEKYSNALRASELAAEAERLRGELEQVSDRGRRSHKHVKKGAAPN